MKHKKLGFLNLLLVLLFVSLRCLFCHEDILGCFQVSQLAESLVMEVPQSHIILQIDLIQKLLSHEFLLRLVSFVLNVKHFVRLLWAKMRLVVEALDLVGVRFPIPVTLNLRGQEFQIVHVVLFLQFSLMNSYQILLLFLPVKLLALEFARILNFLAFFLESLMRQIVDLLNIVDVLLALMLRVIIDLERTLRSHEIRIGLRMVVG